MKRDQPEVIIGPPGPEGRTGATGATGPTGSTGMSGMQRSIERQGTAVH